MALPQSLRSVHRLAGVAPPRITGNVQTDHLVAHQLVDERIRPNQHVGGRIVEPAHYSTELGSTHGFSQTDRSTHIREQK
jgi:hypothetical protein